MKPRGEADDWVPWAVLAETGVGVPDGVGSLDDWKGGSRGSRKENKVGDRFMDEGVRLSTAA